MSGSRCHTCTRWSAPRLLALVGVLALGALPGAAHAAWIAGGNQLCATAGDEVGLLAVPDGSGGVFVAWTDQLIGSSVLATHVLADGSIAPGWPAGALSLGTGRDGPTDAVADGLGGLLLFGVHGISIIPVMWSLNADGTLRPGYSPDGTAVYFGYGGPAGYYARFCGDGVGGYYELHNGPSDPPPPFQDVFRLGRMTAADTPVTGWVSPIVGESPASRAYVQFGLLQDPAGGVLSGEIVSVPDLPSGDSQVGHIRRTLGDGSLGFSDSLKPNGHDGTATGHALITQMSMVPDGSGGAFASWRIGGPLGPASYMQHYLASGAASWPTPTTAPVSDALFRDGFGGEFLLGVPLAATRLELHRRASDASVPTGWEGGRVLSPAGPFSSFAGVRSGTHTYACWSSGGGSADDVFASAFVEDGSLPSGWTAGGNVVCNSPGQQSGVVIVPGTANDAFVAWIDRRSGTQSDVYVSRLLPGGPAVSAVPVGEPLAFSVGPVRPNPARDFADFGLTLPDATPATVELLDLQGRVVAHTTSAGRPGVQRVTLPVSGLANGLYFVHVRHGGHETSQRISVFQ